MAQKTGLSFLTDPVFLCKFFCKVFCKFYFTVTLQVTFLVPLLTVMTAVPFFFAVITPLLLTAATFLLEEA